MTQSLARLPPPNDIKQKSTSANIRFLEEFQSDGPQVIIILLKRVKTETVFKHQLPFYKIPTVSVKSYYKYIFLAPLSFPKECISMIFLFFFFVLILHLQNRGMKKIAKNLPSSSQGQKTAFSPTAWDQGTGARTKYSTRENLGFRTLLHQERRGKQVGRCGSSARRAGSAAEAAAPSPPLPSTVAFFFLLLLHPPRAPRRRPGLPARHSRGRRASGRAGGRRRTGSGGRRAGGRPPPGRLRSAPAPLRLRARPGPAGGGNAGASLPRPAARSLAPRPGPAAPRHERRRWLQAESLPPGRRWLQSAAIILCSLRAAAVLWGSGGGSIFTAAPPARGRPRALVSGASPAPLRPPGSLRLLPPPPAPLTGGTSSSVTAFVRGPDLAGVLFSPPRNTPRQTTPPPRHSPTLRFSQPPGPQAAAAAAD